MSRGDQPAFPLTPQHDCAGFIPQGMSKRELIAAIVMIGLPGSDVANTVEIAIQHADALLAELETPR